MDGILNFLFAFLLVAFSLFMLFGKVDWLLVKYKISFKGGKPALVPYRRYTRRAIPYFAAVFLLLALFLIMEYVLRPIPEWYALFLLPAILPFVLIVELRCREK